MARCAEQVRAINVEMPGRRGERSGVFFSVECRGRRGCEMSIVRERERRLWSRAGILRTGSGGHKKEAVQAQDNK